MLNERMKFVVLCLFHMDLVDRHLLCVLLSRVLPDIGDPSLGLGVYWVQSEHVAWVGLRL